MSSDELLMLLPLASSSLQCGAGGRQPPPTGFTPLTISLARPASGAADAAVARVQFLYVRRC
jgi:hypothetical protein